MTYTETPTDTESPAHEAPTSEAEIEAAADAVFESVLGAMSTQAIFIGDRLGWYSALAEHDSLSPVELADVTDTDDRYAREWLEHQTLAGFTTVDDPTLAPDHRRYRLPAAFAEVLANRDSLSFMTPAARLTAAVSRRIDDTVDAFRNGGGVAWHVHGEDAREAQGDQNRPLFLHVLGQEYLASIPAVDAALRAGGKVADIGCGVGWSAIGVAKAYPEATVDGYDVDPASVEAARANAAESGVADRVTFTLVDIASPPEATGYDLVMALECVHDMSDPVSALASMRQMVAENGTVVIMDERVGETFTGAPDPIEQFMYGYSLLCCLPDGRAHGPSEATGTVMRPATLDGYARRAGFKGAEVLDIENDVFLFYELVR